MKSTWLVPRIGFLPPTRSHGCSHICSARCARPLPAAPAAPPSDGLASAQGLTRRLQALKSALEDLPRQAKRLARWQQRRKAAPDHKFLSPLRPAVRRATAGSPFTKSMKYSSNAMTSPGRR